MKPAIGRATVSRDFLGRGWFQEGAAMAHLFHREESAKTVTLADLEDLVVID